MMKNVRMPSGATVVAWLGIIGTVLGILSFFIADLPSLFRQEAQGLTEAELVATLVALQGDKERAELQLTQIALAEQQSANLSTQQALDRIQMEFQSTVSAVQAEREAVVATQNVVAAVTATADAESAAAAQAAVDASATGAAIAEIVPSATPVPTSTATPAPVLDHRSLVSAAVVADRDGRMVFTLQTAEPIPASPGGSLAYVWSLDVDGDSATGFPVQDIGVEKRVRVIIEGGAWVGTVSDVLADGSAGESLFFVDIVAEGPILQAVVSPAELGLPEAFQWVARAEAGDQAFTFFPVDGHLSYP